MNIKFEAQLTGEANVDAAAVFIEWEHQKHASICGFRNSSFSSIYTGHQAPPVAKKWTEDLE